jgi:hypothetical protein
VAAISNTAAPTLTSSTVSGNTHGRQWRRHLQLLHRFPGSHQQHRQRQRRAAVAAPTSTTAPDSYQQHHHQQHGRQRRKRQRDGGVARASLGKSVSEEHHPWRLYGRQQRLKRFGALNSRVITSFRRIRRLLHQWRYHQQRDRPEREPRSPRPQRRPDRTHALLIGSPAIDAVTAGYPRLPLTSGTLLAPWRRL